MLWTCLHVYYWFVLRWSKDVKPLLNAPRYFPHYKHFHTNVRETAAVGLSTYEPRREKTNVLGFLQGLTQTGLCRHRRWLETWNFGIRKKRDCTIPVAKTKALITFAISFRRGRVSIHLSRCISTLIYLQKYRTFHTSNTPTQNNMK